MYSVEEAVARCFPAGSGYDRNQAKRLIGWLDSCGYVVIAKEQVSGQQPIAVSSAKPLPACLRIERF
jgi:hypothetical protein